MTQRRKTRDVRASRARAMKKSLTNSSISILEENHQNGKLKLAAFDYEQRQQGGCDL